MSDGTITAPVAVPQAEKLQGMRKNGKQWHLPRKAFRPTAGLKSYERRTQERALIAQMKAKEKEMKEEKEAERKQRTQAIKDKRARKEERERYEKMAETMHKKRVERLKRKEKRNKLINS
ncbi:rRNA-processing protein cgr1 [Neonectria magnoliae]|uniref:rRNA-processing protein n=1 Tax=Neonectria magnoliae TaxID=2732573 RepID=A0ABR1ICS5_9HYPO